jgi:PPOX class probable FMN-dependent enzyme
MTAYEPDPAFAVSDEASLRALFPLTHDLAVQKVLTALDDHAKDYIARSPFLCLGTQNGAGKADVSPRGDPAGFVTVLDDQTLAIPDRPGNNRLDSLSNILSNPSVGLLFIVPGFDDTMRVNGKASLTTDPTVLDKMQVNGRTPTLAIIVRIETVFIHCAKAFRRSKLWDPDMHQDRKELPSLVQIVLEQINAAPHDPTLQKELDDGLEDAYRTTMY